MSIKTQVRDPELADKGPEFPVLRKHHFNANEATYGPLIVLFSSEDRGVALSGVPPERVGVPEEWKGYTESGWEPTSITLTSEN